MPWRTATVMDERANFVFEARRGDLSISELCRRFGISRPTGYKWPLRRSAGLEAIRDRSHRPHSCPHQISAEVEQRIVELRKHRRWGAPKLQRLLEQELGWAPAIATIHRILDRRGLVQHRKPRRSREKPARTPFEADRPNALWTADFKGHFRTRDGLVCHPLTIQDACSRFLLECRALPTLSLDPALSCFRRAFRTYGLPDRIRTDNGSPFASPSSIGRLSSLSAWWIQLGIKPEPSNQVNPSRTAVTNECTALSSEKRLTLLASTSAANNRHSMTSGACSTKSGLTKPSVNSRPLRSTAPRSACYPDVQRPSNTLPTSRYDGSLSSEISDGRSTSSSSAICSATTRRACADRPSSLGCLLRTPHPRVAGRIRQPHHGRTWKAKASVNQHCKQSGENEL